MVSKWTPEMTVMHLSPMRKHDTNKHEGLIVLAQVPNRGSLPVLGFELAAFQSPAEETNYPVFSIPFIQFSTIVFQVVPSKNRSKAGKALNN